MAATGKTKVFMLGWEFPPHSTGGLGFACLGLAQALVGSDVDLTFVLPRKIDASYGKSIKMLFADVPHLHIEGVDTKLHGYVTHSEYEQKVKGISEGMYGGTLLAEVIRYAELVRELAKRQDFDVIHAHDWLSILAGVAAKEVSGKPLVIHIHATSFDQAGGDNANPATYAIERYGMEHADMVIAVSEFTRRMIIDKYGVDPSKVRVVHNGVLRMTGAGEGKMEDIMALKHAGYKVVLYVGRITIQKGVDHFLKAARRTLEYEPDTVFVVAGTGDMENQLIHEAGALGILDKVLFVNKFIGPEEKMSLFHSADLFVMPSVSEPFGLLPLEVLLDSHTPVLISKQSGVSEVLRNALKVDFWDTDEMANKIIAVLRHEPLSNQLAVYGKGEAEGVTWDKAAAKCVGIYHELIDFFRTKVS